MTPDQLYQYQLHVRLVFLEEVMRTMLKMMAAHNERDARQFLQGWASQMLQKTEGVQQARDSWQIQASQQMAP